MVAVLRVRVVRMGVGQRPMSVFVTVPDAGRDRYRYRMVVSMMLTMGVPVHVRHGLMSVLVLMPLRQMQSHSDRHQDRCDDQRHRDRGAERHC